MPLLLGPHGNLLLGPNGLLAEGTPCCCAERGLTCCEFDCHTFPHTLTLRITDLNGTCGALAGDHEMAGQCEENVTPDGTVIVITWFASWTVSLNTISATLQCNTNSNGQSIYQLLIVVTGAVNTSWQFDLTLNSCIPFSASGFNLHGFDPAPDFTNCDTPTDFNVDIFE
jgi:hypothetical protein